MNTFLPLCSLKHLDYVFKKMFLQGLPGESVHGVMGLTGPPGPAGPPGPPGAPGSACVASGTEGMSSCDKVS